MSVCGGEGEGGAVGRWSFYETLLNEKHHSESKSNSTGTKSLGRLDVCICEFSPSKS